MKNPITYLALAIVFSTIIFAVIFRYEYMGQRLGFEIRSDRWTGCIESWNNKEKLYKNMGKCN